VLGSIGLTWFSSTHKPDEALRRYLPDLLEAAREISARLSAGEAQGAAAPAAPTDAA
jgi:DNA-binding IclR family transcriptional regulator